jgi:hypothetical protein
MRYAIVHKFPMDIDDDSAIKIGKGLVKKKKEEVLKSKSLRLMNDKAVVGLDGDDFVKARKTLKVSFDAYKVLRIIKRRLIK